MDYAQEIINRIADNPNGSNIGILSNKLLREFSRGYALDHLRPLLLDKDNSIAEIGIWIASELGQGAKPLLSDVVTLLKHAAKNVRYFAIDSVLSCTTEMNISEVASVIPLIDDTVAAVRWKVMDFLSRSSREKLQGALNYLNIIEPDSNYVRGLQWLLSESSSNPENVMLFVKGQDALLRKYGVVAAVRASKDNWELLVNASSSEDTDIKHFASDVLKSK